MISRRRGRKLSVLASDQEEPNVLGIPVIRRGGGKLKAPLVWAEPLDLLPN